MRIFKYKKFAKFATKQKISDALLCEIVREIENGTIHANLGSHVLKQRVARDGQGRSKGYRVILFYKAAQRTFFVHGFAKSDEDNISRKQEADFKELAQLYLTISDLTLMRLIDAGEILEIACYDKTSDT